MNKKILILAGALVLLSGCGGKKVDVPGTAETEAATTTVTEATSAEATEDTTGTTTQAETPDNASGESSAEETTKAPDESGSYDLGGNGFVSFSMPEITVTMPDISLPDMSVPDIYEYMGEEYAAYTTSAGESAETTAETEAQTSSEPVETEISDGGFVFQGKAMEIGDDEHGYIMVPADFYKFYDAEATNLIQYSDGTQYNVITIKHLPGVDSYTAVQGIMKGLDEKGIVEGLTGATVKMGDYDAYQVYGGYPDGIFQVIWVVEDKNAPENGSYYICFELDSVHQNAFALASTYKMPKDHK